MVNFIFKFAPRPSKRG